MKSPQSAARRIRGRDRRRGLTTSPPRTLLPDPKTFKTLRHCRAGQPRRRPLRQPERGAPPPEREGLMAQVHSVDPRKLADRLKYGPEVASYAAAAATAALLRTKVVIVEAQPRAGARLARIRS